jgi:hypothetical protein
MNWLELIIGIVAGFAGGYAFRFVIDNRKSTRLSDSKVGDVVGDVNQRNNFAGGHIAGRDVNANDK